jgi:hypothetical protein
MAREGKKTVKKPIKRTRKVSDVMDRFDFSRAPTGEVEAELANQFAAGRWYVVREDDLIFPYVTDPKTGMRWFVLRTDFG